jgi:hypothetical protein
LVADTSAAPRRKAMAEKTLMCLGRRAFVSCVVSGERYLWIQRLDRDGSCGARS